MKPIQLSDPLAVAGVTATMAERFAKDLGVHTVGDLLRHFPRRFERLGELTAIAELPENEPVSVIAEVVTVERRPMRARKGDLLRLVVTDGDALLPMTFFHAHRGLESRMKPGTRWMFTGTTNRYRGTLQLNNPRIVSAPDELEAIMVAGGLEPVYPASAGLAQSRIRATIRMVLDPVLAQGLPDPVPLEVRARHGLMELSEALAAIHRPQEEKVAQEALRRFIFEEAFVLQVVLASRRADERALVAIVRRSGQGGLLAAFDQRLTFDLTPAQKQVGEDIAADLARDYPMHRLLQGEVGSGKTVVAVRAMLTVVDAGGQAALLAPTEVLAAQHHHSISAMLGELAEGSLLGGKDGTRVVLLTGSLSAARRREALSQIASGEAGIVIGTHALLQDKVSFADLGLIVVDEQHRFGVEQRNVLRDKAVSTPHLLVMTATPIPRTVAMTVFGDLETSTMVEVPAGRADVATHVVALSDKPGWYQRVWARVREEVDSGRQAFVVCPRIDPDGADEPGAEPGPVAGHDSVRSGGAAPRPPLRAVIELLDELRATPELAGLRIEMLHGRMPAEERDAVMAAVVAGDVDVLVATTVIEVGVDVPNASVMVVMDADRFGISQLHQLRGRIGRGAHPGLCLLVTPAEAGSPARERLDAVAATRDGFALARVDLDQRREGDVLGASQSGSYSSLRKLRVLRDEKVIIAARHEATAVIAADPELRTHRALADAIDTLLDSERQAYLERG